MEIKFEPYEKITFRSHLDYSTAEKFVNAIALGSPPGVPSRARLFWANGVLFRQFALPQNEASTKESIKGNLVWDHIEFASMPEYKKELQGPPDRPLVTVFILDVSNHIVFNPLTKWIKNNLM